jgi:pterin-4a-carbinolamine dehydratase
MDRGGHDGWETEANLAYMQKQFEFKSFEEANSFVQHVSKFCNQKEHHPEWSVSNGGRTVNVKLTSHFAGNRVTRLDFELAEAMNNSYFLTAGRFSRGPLADEKLWSTIRILVGSFVALSFFYTFVTRPGFVLKEQPRSGVPIKQEMDFSGAVAFKSQLVADRFSRDNLIAWGSV